MGVHRSKNRASGTTRETIRWMVYNVFAQLCTPWRSLQQAIRDKWVKLDMRKEGQRCFWLCFCLAGDLQIFLLFPGCDVSRTSWTLISQNALWVRLSNVNIWLLQWDCSFVVFLFLRCTCWSLNKWTATVSSRLFGRKGYVTKSWKFGWNQSLWFCIANVYFWS